MPALRKYASSSFKKSGRYNKEENDSVEDQPILESIEDAFFDVSFEESSNEISP